MNKVTSNKIDSEDRAILDRIAKSLRKEVAYAKSYGFDVKSHWKEMLDSVEVEKAEIK